jgi:CRP-like cAMP-binding protein
VDLIEAARIAGSHGWLSFTPPAFRDAVLGRCQLQHVAAGKPVYNIGDPPGGMYGLVAGSLGVSIAPAERGPYLAHFARPGTWVGEGCLVTGRPRQVGLIATRSCDLLHLPMREFLAIAADDPAAWRWVALLTALHLDTAMGAADDLMIRDHVRRFVAILLRLAGCRLAPPPSDAPVEVHVNQEEIAHMANVARTTAGAILRDLEAAGSVDLSYRTIRVVNPAALRAMLARE